MSRRMIDEDTPFTPNGAETEYDDAMAKLNASLQRSAAVRTTSLNHDGSNQNGGGSSSSIRGNISNFLHDVDVDDDDDDYDYGDQLPSIEEARTTAATALSRVDRAMSDHSSRNRNMFDADDEDDEQLQDKFLGGSPGRKRRRVNWYKVAFFVLVAIVFGLIIGLSVGFSVGKKVERLEEGATPTVPRPLSNPTPRPVSSLPQPTPDAPIGREPQPTSQPQASEPQPSGIPTPTPVSNAPVSPAMFPVSLEEVKAEQVMEWLVQQSIVADSQFFDVNSTQYKAAHWIAEVDTMNLPIPVAVGDTNSLVFIERYALAVFFMGLQGTGWSYNFKFLSADSACNWNVDVTLPDKRRLQVGVVCDSNGSVQSINIPQNNLEGSLVSELGLLTNLNFVALNHNLLKGTVPVELGELTKLTYLALHYNQLTGTLPSWLGDLTEMRVLGLGDNKFSGKIPDQWSSMLNLVTLGIDNNSNLSGDITALQPLTNLERMYLEENAFTQDLNSFDWTAFRSLQELDLSGNFVSGTLPDTLTDLPKLEILDLGGNTIGGKIPNVAPKAPVLRYLGLHDNTLTGSIPSQIALISTLTHLDLSDNTLTGLIPHQLSNLQNLDYLFLANNDGFQPAAIPPFIGAMTKLTDLSLKGTQRAAGIPTTLFANLEKLVLLELDSNLLTGQIPSEIGALSSLTYLLLNHNIGIWGTVPTEVQMLPRIDIFLVDRTGVEGDLNALCNNRTTKPQIAGADCGGDSPEITCSCCNICCVDGVNTTECRDRVYFGQLDPIWEDSFQRKAYQFADQGFGRPDFTTEIEQPGTEVGSGNDLGASGDEGFNFTTAANNGSLRSWEFHGGN